MTFDVKRFLDDISLGREWGKSKPVKDRIFENLLTVLAQSDIRLKDLDRVDQIENLEYRRRLLDIHNSEYRKLNDLFARKSLDFYAEQALKLQQPAFDKGCALIVEHFFEDKIFSVAAMDKEFKDTLVANDIELHSELGQEMMRAAHKIFPEYRAIYYREIAGGVFGFPVDDIQKAEYKAHRDQLLENAMNAVYERMYPDDHDPTAP